MGVAVAAAVGDRVDVAGVAGAAAARQAASRAANAREMIASRVFR
jgi:hypothetical protein